MAEAARHKALREAKKQMKAKYGIPCPKCVAAPPKAPPPRVLLGHGAISARLAAIC